MRVIRVVVPFDTYKVDEVVEVEDQVGLDACVQGYAVTSLEAVSVETPAESE